MCESPKSFQAICQAEFQSRAEKKGGVWGIPSHFTYKLGVDWVRARAAGGRRRAGRAGAAQQSAVATEPIIRGLTPISPADLPAYCDIITVD